MPQHQTLSMSLTNINKHMNNKYYSSGQIRSKQILKCETELVCACVTVFLLITAPDDRYSNKCLSMTWCCVCFSDADLEDCLKQLVKDVRVEVTSGPGKVFFARDTR